MDLIDIDYHDDLAAYTRGELPFDNWITLSWNKFVLEDYKFQIISPYYEKAEVPIDDLRFTVGNDHIELYEGVYILEPQTSVAPDLKGHYNTLDMTVTLVATNGKVRGKMCIHNPSKPKIVTDYEICLKRSQIKMTVGLAICGDGLSYNYCNYQFPSYEISFTYQQDAQTKSVFSREADPKKRRLLEQYVLEHFMSDLCDAIKNKQLEMLSIKHSVSTDLGNSYSYRNLLRIHNRKHHTAFANLSKKIISLAITLIDKKSKKLYLDKVFALVADGNNEKKLKVYKGFLEGLDSFSLSEKKNVIVSKQGDLVILNVPVTFKELMFNYEEITGAKAENDSKYQNPQKYSTSASYLILHLKRQSKDMVEISLENFKIHRISHPLSHPRYYHYHRGTEEYYKHLERIMADRIDFTLDYMVTSVIEDTLRPYIELAVKNGELQELAINPDVEIEYYPDDFASEDSD